MNREQLLNKMRGINNWIAENPDVTEPNMYEMIDCVTAIGVVAKEENIAQRPNRFPEAGSDLAELYGEWNKMYKSRFGSDAINNPNFSVNRGTKLYNYFMNLNMDCCTGEFAYPENEAERREFLECLKKVGSIDLYINQQKLQNPEFVYDNKNEYDALMEMIEKYDDYMPDYSRSVIDEIGESMIIVEKTAPDTSDDLII